MNNPKHIKVPIKKKFLAAAFDSITTPSLVNVVLEHLKILLKSSIYYYFLLFFVVEALKMR